MEATVDHLNQMMSSLLTQNTSLTSQLNASKKRKSGTIDISDPVDAEEDYEESEDFVELGIEEHEGKEVIKDRKVSDGDLLLEDAFAYNTDSPSLPNIPEPAPYDETTAPPLPVEEMDGLFEIYAPDDGKADDLPPSPDGLANELKQFDPKMLRLVLQACKTITQQEQEKAGVERAMATEEGQDEQDGSIALPLASAAIGAFISTNVDALANKAVLEKEQRVAVSVKG